ncbi:DUF4427 domain-containing protein [Pseudomonas taiwanensis]|uniref:DUF4427 domain-containing protein n=1 Tax=Pseudomonas taiwanensis TaxID=470150 RepID=UPI001675AF8A|nr:DUF4427 domain-containing protein [Pseudomonas taiwanensis]
MVKEVNSGIERRVAHFFRDVDLRGQSCPEFVPESFPTYCQPDDDDWSAGLLLRVAMRMHHLWPTYGIRDGNRTIQGEHPAVCFANFSLADLIAVRDGLTVQNGVVTQYAITFPQKAAEEGGLQPVIQWVGEQAYLQDGTPIDGVMREDADNQYRYIADDPNSSYQPSAYLEWRWRYPRNYRSNIKKIEANGYEGNVIPGLKLTQKKWSGMGIVVPDMVTARLLQYDILSLIDRGVVSETHVDHILVCDQLPETIEGLDDHELQEAFSKACFDFKSCLHVSTGEADVADRDLSSRVAELETSTAREAVREWGGCWLWFQDNTHPYVRALVKAGRVKPNLKGRYLASLNDLNHGRDLREREAIVLALSEQLREKFGIRSTYFSVRNSYSPDDDPAYAGRIWGGGYFVLPAPEDDDEDM